ncbi:class I SAM-dependent RNA methyltransferase [Anaerotignum sp.]|uniref:THUMP domain-containing class I SAM-dependent RNA methyltransferase n=1 Tax=Anaerotignum sp. TaxID=2039241 RepID=UPI0033301DE1
MMSINLIASTTFGLESVVKRECQALGFQNIQTSDGRVEFTGNEEDIVRANLWLRCAGRVWIKMANFTAVTFTELFDQTKALPWGDWIPEDGKFTVVGKSVKSTLFSVPDCQAIVKKAVVEKLKEKYKTDWFDETGASYTIQVGILKDVVTLAIDTSGSGLHMRGYRAKAMDAPLKESIASAMVQLSFWRKDRILLDPFCGSGTIPIEAAMIARNIAPGLQRKFACEEWDRIGKDLWKKVRAEAYQAIDYEVTPQIYGSDIDPNAIALAKENAEKAGVDDCITFEVKPSQEITLPGKYGVVITNPPYGERIGELKEVEEMYRALGGTMKTDYTWSTYLITSMEYFETLFGRKADKKRKLFNGRIKTDYYQFEGPRPPRA